MTANLALGMLEQGLAKTGGPLASPKPTPTQQRRLRRKKARKNTGKVQPSGASSKVFPPEGETKAPMEGQEESEGSLDPGGKYEPSPTSEEETSSDEYSSEEESSQALEGPSTKSKR